MKTAALLVALALLWALMLLIGGPHSPFDLALSDLLYAGDRPLLANAARVVTELGSLNVLAPVTAIAAVALIVQRRMGAAALLLFITAGGRLAVELQKASIARLRPELHEQLVHVVSLSFPSAHSANSTITYLGIALLLGRRRPWLIAAGLIALTIGITRVMLGVHWASDLIGGWAFGLFWLLAIHGLFASISERRPPPF